MEQAEQRRCLHNLLPFPPKREAWGSQNQSSRCISFSETVRVGQRAWNTSFKGRKKCAVPRLLWLLLLGPTSGRVTLYPLYRQGYHWENTATRSSVELALPWHRVSTSLAWSYGSGGLTSIRSKEHDWPQERDSWDPKVNQAPWTLTWLITSLHSGTATAVGTGSPLRS